MTKQRTPPKSASARRVAAPADRSRASASTPAPPLRSDVSHEVGQISEPLGLLDVREDTTRIVLGAGEDAGGNYAAGTFRVVVSAMITALVLISAAYMTPALADVGVIAETPLVSFLRAARPWTEDDPVPFWNLIGRELLGEDASASATDEEVSALEALATAEVAAEEEAEAFSRKPVKVVKPPQEEVATIPAYVAHPDDDEPVERALEKPEALDPFWAALTRTDLAWEGAVTRATHYGDSAIGNDGITAAVRVKLQARFGDAGHGFHLLGQPNLSYRHKGVSFVEKSPWAKCFIIFGCRDDRHYGLGGTTFNSAGGAEITLGTASKGPAGRAVSRFELWYAARPKGGRIRLQVDKEEPILLETAADELEDRWHVLEVEDGAHSLSVRAAGGGKVRAYGVVLERDGPGVVWDGMSQIGAMTRRMLNFDPDHLQRQLRRRQSNMVVLMFGGNDMGPHLNLEKYKESFSLLLRGIKAAGPHMSCLVMAPLDHGERRGAQIVTRPIVPKLVAAQREVALEEGCAFWDTYEAMGGDGSMGRWTRSEPRLGSGDLAHLTHHGHKVIGAMLYRALMAGYRDYRARVEGKPVRELERALPPVPEDTLAVIAAPAHEGEEVGASSDELDATEDGRADAPSPTDAPSGAPANAAAPAEDVDAPS
ncbi:MAG: hypothetical protein KC468_37690, partial [Myxococcales bacterium]|nr:hypothetical protein [Myxococcales bacterium]